MLFPVLLIVNLVNIDDKDIVREKEQFDRLVVYRLGVIEIKIRKFMFLRIIFQGELHGLIGDHSIWINTFRYVECFLVAWRAFLLIYFCIFGKLKIILQIYLHLLALA